MGIRYQIYILKLLSLIFISFFCFSIFAQSRYPLKPYEPYDFKAIKPVWYDTYYMEEIKSDICDGYNMIEMNRSLKPIIIGNYIYNTKVTRTPIDFFTEGYIEKRNILTGKIGWKNYFKLGADAETNRQELIKELHISEDKVTSFNIKRFVPYGTNDPQSMGVSCTNARLVKRVYDNISGKQLNYLNTDLSDTTKAILANYRRYPNGLSQSQLIYISENKIEYTYFGLFNDFQDYTLLKFHLDTFGRIISDTDSFKFPINYNKKYYHRLSCNDFRAINASMNNVHIYSLDGNFEVISEFKSPEFSSLQAFEIIAKFDSFFVFHYNKGTLFEPVLEYIKMDYQGNIITKAQFPDDANYLSNPLVFDFPDSTAIYCLSTRQFIAADGYYYRSLVVLKSNDLGGFDILKENSNQLYELRYVIPAELTPLPDGNFIVEFVELAYRTINFPAGTLSTDPDAQAISIACFTPEALGLTMTSNTTETSKAISVTLSPNPSQDYLDIGFSSDYEGNISIMSVDGKVLRRINLGLTNKVSLDISSLKNGVYIVQFNNKENVFFSQRFIKQ